MVTWSSYLHTFRKREFEKIFSHLPKKIFPSVLELGAGDTFQSHLLEEYGKKVVATDYDRRITLHQDTPTLQFTACDAEYVDAVFPPYSFTCIFSSNLLEHIPNIQRALQGMRTVLREDGIMIHVMPSPFWKLSYSLLYYPGLAITILRKYLVRSQQTIQQPYVSNVKAVDFENNPKLRARKNLLSRAIFPDPHGASSNHLKEFFDFSPRRWVREFDQAGFRVFSIFKGPVASGHGFGMDKLRSILEHLGCTAEYVYLSTQKGCVSPYERYFT